MTKNKRNAKISALMSESDSNSGNRKLIRLIRQDNRKGIAKFFCNFPLVWW